MSIGVLHLRSSTGLYGAEQVLLGLCQQQALRLGRPAIAAFTADPEQPPDLLRAAWVRGLQVVPLRCRGPIDPGCVRRLRQLLRETRVELLHCHDYKSVVYARIASSGLRLARVATLHGWLRHGLRLAAYRWLELRALRGFDRVCAVSEDIADELVDAGLAAEQVRRVDNGIDVERFQPQAAPEPRANPDIVELGCAARLSPEKNLAELIRAVAECRRQGRRLRLTICGEGPLRERLISLIDALELHDTVHLIGVCRGMAQWYSSLDALVLPSLTEGMPMTVLEALACGCPVVASAVGAIPTLLHGLNDCQLLPPGDRAALVDALLSVQPRQVPQWQARARVVERFSLGRMTETYQAVYREALEA